MDDQERMEKNLPYRVDETLFARILRARRLTQKINTMDCTDLPGLERLFRQLLGRCGSNFMINPPFRCDYGSNIEIGENFFANYNCTLLDVGKIRIGDNCMLAPNVSIYTAGHPLHPDTRRSGYEYGLDVTIGNDVWIGGDVVICPGVHIGDCCVIGAGSVVTRDIPAWSVAAGNPCRVLRAITEEDRRFYWRDREFDEEAWAEAEAGRAAETEKRE